MAKDKSATLQEKQAAVAGLLDQFPALLKAVRGLMGKKPVSDLKPQVVRDPVAAIVALKPAILRLQSPDTHYEAAFPGHQ